jgi:hypothetical protein
VRGTAVAHRPQLGTEDGGIGDELDLSPEMVARLVSTVGRDETVIREYIRKQEQPPGSIGPVALIGHLLVANKIGAASATPIAASSGLNPPVSSDAG